MSIQVSQYINPSEHLTFQFRGEQTVVVACEIWRRTPKGMVRFVDIKPYYKFDIDTSVLSKDETDGLFANIQQTKKFGQKAYEKGKTLLNFVMEGNADNTLLGVQIDESSKFGTKVEISFSDYERLLYKVVRTDDIMYLWATNMSKSVAMAGITGGLVSGGSKILLHTYYNNDIKFAVGAKKYLTKKLGFPYETVDIKNGVVVDTLCNAGQSTEGMINKVFKSKKLDRDIPHFGGLITVKNFHIGGSAQTRMNAQDPARMFQHLKINYGFEEENKTKEAKRGKEDYISNSFWKMIEKTARYCHDERLHTETLRATRANDPSGQNRITGKIDIEASVFFRILVDRVYADTRFVEHNDKDMLLMAFDKSIKEGLFGKTKDKDAKIRFIHARNNNLAPRKYYLDLEGVNEHNANGTIPLATALTKPLSRGFTSERWTPDELDVYTKPELDANMKSPSLIDFINMWVSNYVYYNSLVYGDVSRNIWVKSNIFMNQNGISSKKGTGTIITLLFTFSGRDNSTGELITSDREHKLFLDEISELDVFEINRRGQVSECLIADEDDVSQSFASCSLAHRLYTDTIYSHKPKIIMFDTIKPLIKFDENIVKKPPTNNLATVIDNESYFPELKDRVDNIVSDNVVGLMSSSFAKSENLRIAERLERLGITPNKQFKIRLNFSSTIQALFNFAGDDKATELSINYGGTRPFIIKDEYQFKDFFEQCQAFLTSDNMTRVGKRYFTVRAGLGLGTAARQIKYTSLSGNNLTLLSAATKKIFTYLDGDNVKTNQVIINALDYTKSNIVSFKDDTRTGWRNQFANPVVTLKGYLLKLIFVAIELAVETVKIFLHDLANTNGRNGSIYLASHPEIQVGDTLYLVEDQSNILSLADRLLTKKFPTVGNIARNASALIGNTKPLMSAIRSKDPITKKGRKGKEYFEKDLQTNGEGKIFVDDVALLTDPEGKKIPRWFVYRHVMYIGNFGSTSGFMSKIYMVDEPLNSNMPFDEDNIVTRQLSTFLHRSRLADDAPLSWQRMI